MTTFSWNGLQHVAPIDYTCGYCGREVTSDTGLWAKNEDAGLPTASLYQVANVDIRICPRCTCPTFLAGGGQVPRQPFGDRIDHLPDAVGTLYQEARDSVSRGNWTAATMVGRKLLMNIAHTKGAEAGQSFQAYVTYLLEQHVITPAMETWVDEIRKLGNEANHEIPPVTREDAEDLVTFLAMLLQIVYEYPGRHQAATAAKAQRAAASE